MRAADHHRVCDAGKKLGSFSAYLAAQGRQRLAAAGLASVEAPRLRAGMCASCACRPATVPNGCLQTQLDFLKSVVEGVPFLCHAPKDGKLCAGWVAVRAETQARPLPQALEQAAREWQFSPEDDAA